MYLKYLVFNLIVGELRLKESVSDCKVILVLQFDRDCRGNGGLDYASPLIIIYVESAKLAACLHCSVLFCFYNQWDEQCGQFKDFKLHEYIFFNFIDFYILL